MNGVGGREREEGEGKGGRVEVQQNVSVRVLGVCRVRGTVGLSPT